MKLQLVPMASPNFGAEKLRAGNVQDLVDVHEDRVLSWMFRPARAILKHPHSEFAVLSIVLPYFESHAILCKGESSEGHSSHFFVETFQEVFPPPLPEKKLENVQMPKDFSRWLGKKLYKLARCGLFHQASASRIAIGPIDEPIWASVSGTPQTPFGPEPNYVGEIEGAIINPELFLDSVERHFDRYLRTLRDQRNLAGQERFRRGWDLIASTPAGIFPDLEE